MKKIALLIAFTFLSLAMCTAEDKEPELIDISSICSAKQFDKIVDFILQKGQTQTYCSMYNDNPFYQFGDISVYLNPRWQMPSKEQAKEHSTYSNIEFDVTNQNRMLLDIWKNDEGSKVYTDETTKQRYTTLEDCLKRVLKEVSPKKWYTPN